MLTRFPDWQSRLDAFLADNHGRAFRYGHWDCCLFVCDAVQAMTGVDMAATLRDKYETRPGALDAIYVELRARKLEHAITSIADAHGLVPVPAEALQRGDVALLQRPRGDCSLGLVSLCGKHVIVLTARKMEKIPIQRAARGWHV